MSTTHRSDSALLPGYHHSGDRGLGVLGSQIPSAGEHGPAIPYPSLALPADAGKEIIASILTVPVALTLFAVDEFGAVDAEGPDGAHVGTFRLWADGEDRGTATYTVLIGGQGLSGTATGQGDTASGAIFSGVSGLSGVAQAAGDTALGGMSGVITMSAPRSSPLRPGRTRPVAASTRLRS